jgi:hypothetical protein
LLRYELTQNTWSRTYQEISGGQHQLP